MGIRATLETVMIDKVGDHHRFSANVDEFQKAGYLSVRQAGPTDSDIATLLDITESIIETASP